MTIAKISSSKLKDSYIIPTSKSYAARMILSSIVKVGSFSVSDIPVAQDTQELIKSLETLSLIDKYDIDNQSLSISKSFPEDEAHTDEVIDIYLGEGGTTIRFMLSFLSLGRNSYRIKVHPRFKDRPYQQQLNYLASLGVKIELSNEPDFLCTLKGPILENQSLKIDCSQTTQVASSFELIKAKVSLDFDLMNLSSSKAYYEMTKSVVDAKESNLKVPVDMSSASYYIALSAKEHGAKFPQILFRDKLQADDKVLDLLDHDFSPHLHIKKQKLKAFKIDASKCIDLVPTLVFLAAFAEGKSVISGIQNLIYKETNRLEGIREIMDFFKIDFELSENVIEINGVSNSRFLEKKSLITKPDHRLVMLGSLILKIYGGGEIDNSECVKKSFPSFFELLS